jgi:hypothetical protein
VPLERVPTASVLMRLTYSSIDYEGNFISIKDSNPTIRDLAYEQAPDFKKGGYSTLYYINSNDERELYSIRRSRKIDVPLIEVMQATADIKNVKSASTEQILDYYKKILTNGKNVGMIDLSFLTPYTPAIGLRMNVEAVSGCSLTDSVLYSVVSIVPPGAPYNKNDRQMTAAFISMQTNWDDSNTNHLTFNDDDTAFQNILLFNSSVILVDIKQYNYKT